MSASTGVPANVDPTPLDASILADIENDLPRTYFQGDQNQLRNLLIAVANRHPECGYVQGLNYLAATILNQYKSDYDESFRTLMGLLSSHNLKEIYYDGLQKLISLLDQIDYLLENYMPMLHAHFVSS